MRIREISDLVNEMGEKKSIRIPRRHHCAFTTHLMQEGLSLTIESIEIKDLCVCVCVDRKRFGK